jgi:hypothetical protein
MVLMNIGFQAIARKGEGKLLAVVPCDQLFLASSKGCFFNFQAFTNDTLDPILQAGLTM